MFFEPCPHHLSVVNADIIADEVNSSDFHRCRSFDLLEQLDEFHLPFASAQNAHHLAGARIKGSKEVKRPFACVFVFKTGWHQPWLRRARRRTPCSWLQRCFLIEAQHPFMSPEWSSIQIADLQNLFSKRLIPGRLGAQPVVNTPRLELVRCQDALHALRRDAVHHSGFPKGTRQFSTCPQRQRSALFLR